MFDNPKDGRVLFLDMNAFFAACEQQVRPALRGKPIGVTPYTGDTGCVIAPSYEAKAWGVKTGMMVGQARRLCPRLQIIESRPRLYLFYHEELVKLLHRHCPIVRTLSVDEFALMLPADWQRKGRAWQLARAIKAALKEDLGEWFTASVGIGPNIYLAKCAAESRKPDGLVELRLRDLALFFSHIPTLEELKGIKGGIANRLRLCGIETPRALFAASLDDLRRALGAIGLTWYFRLRGFEVDAGEHRRVHIGHSHVLAPEFRTFERARAVAAKLGAKVGKRLRASGHFASALTLAIQFLEGGFWHKTAKCGPFQDNHTLLRLLGALFDGAPKKRPLLLGVTAHNLIRSFSEPHALFDHLNRAAALSRALDEINDRFGPETIHAASIFDVDEAAPDRIPFGSVDHLLSDTP